MPQTIIRMASDQLWARFDKTRDGRAVRWVGIEEATRFPSEEVANLAFKETLQEMRLGAQAKAERVNAKGGRVIKANGIKWRDRDAFNAAAALLSSEQKMEILKSALMPDWARTTQNSNLDSAFQRYGWVNAQSKASDHLPQWVQGKLKTCLESVAQVSDLLAPMEVWFVRSDAGWLGLDGKCQRHFPELHQAKPFFSEAAARSALGQSNLPGSALVRAQMLISNIMGAAPEGSAWKPDPVSAQLRSGCEAREIDSFIQEAARARAAALPPEACASEEAPAPPRARSRL